MTLLMFGMFCFMVARTFIYFRANKPVAGILATLGSLLFLAGLVTSFLTTKNTQTEVAERHVALSA